MLPRQFIFQNVSNTQKNKSKRPVSRIFVYVMCSGIDKTNILFTDFFKTCKYRYQYPPEKSSINLELVLRYLPLRFLAPTQYNGGEQNNIFCAHKTEQFQTLFRNNPPVTHLHNPQAWNRTWNYFQAKK